MKHIDMVPRNTGLDTILYFLILLDYEITLITQLKSRYKSYHIALYHR